jgi:altronate hydrolase
VAGGCNLVAFTTGRGSVYGASTVPTVKIATTSQLFERMKGDMDFDAGQVLNAPNIDLPAAQLFKLLVRIASGEEQTRSESLHLGWEEFVPWALGETL